MNDVWWILTRRSKLKRLNAASTVVDTSVGPVEYARHGTSGGPTVVLVHGTPQGHQAISFAQPMVDAGFDVICPSRPGYLRTPLSTGWSFEAQADAVAALLDALEIGRAAVWGVSGGGPSSIQFAARHPERTSALILEVAVSQPLQPDVPDWLLKVVGGEFFHELNALLMRLAPRFAINQFVGIESTLAPEDRRRVVDAILSDPEKRGFLKRLLETGSPMSALKDGFQNDLERFRDLPPLPFGEVRCPTLVVHGTHDRDVPFAHGELSAREIPGARLLAVERGWHLLRLGDDPDGHTQAQIAFLREHAGSVE